MTMRKNCRGFTSVEVLAVVSVMFIIFGISTSSVLSVINLSRRVKTEENLRDLGGAIEKYFHDVGQFPSRLDAAGLALLVQNLDRRAGWRGPYIDGPILRRFQDEWNAGLRYRFAQSPRGVPVAIVLSAGRNGRVDSDLGTYMNDGWLPGRDDIAFKISAERMIKEQEERTRRILRDAAAMLQAQSPNLAPQAYDSGMVDAWNRPIQYVRCSTTFAAVFSTGFNGNNDSGGSLCPLASAQPDDLAEFVSYSLTRRIPGLLNPGWTGGIHGSNVLCDSYTYILVNNFNDYLRIEYYDRQKNFLTVNVNPRSTVVVTNVYPWFPIIAGTARVPLVVYRGSLISDQFNPINADLDQDCYHVKTFG